MTANRDIGVAILGMGWMGGVHARAFSSLSRLDDLPLTPKLIFCADDNAERLQWAQRVFGFTKAGDDWRQALTLSEVDLICVTAPHRISRRNGRSRRPAPANTSTAKNPSAADSPTPAAPPPPSRPPASSPPPATTTATSPSSATAAQLLQEGRLGAIEQINAHFLSMYGANPPLTTVLALPKRPRRQRRRRRHPLTRHRHRAKLRRPLSNGSPPTPKPSSPNAPCPPPAPNPTTPPPPPTPPWAPVENEDYIGVLAEYENGAVGQLQASRVARGPQIANGLRPSTAKKDPRLGTFERMNELQLYLPAAGDPTRDGFTRLLGGAVHPGHSRINPGRRQRHRLRRHNNYWKPPPSYATSPPANKTPTA